MLRLSSPAAAILLLSLIAAGPAPAQTPPAAPATADQQQQDAALKALLQKKNVYTKLYNETLRIADSWSRYLSWVNPQKGPTGKERIIYGLYSVSIDSINKAAAEASALTTQEPQVPDLDATVRDLIPLLAPVMPVINAADAYYERQDYKDDGAKLARDYHAKLVAMMPPILALRERMSRQLDALSDTVDERQLAYIERVDGKRYSWHSRRILSSARKLSNFIDINLKKTALPTLDKAIADYAATVRDFDAYLAQPDAQHGIMESQPRSFLSKMREMRDEVARGQRPGGMMGTTFIVNDYNMLIGNFGSGFIR